MKIGENGIIIFSMPDVDLELIDKVIFTFQGYGRITKSYPSNGVSYDNGRFFIGLNQEDTMILAKEMKIKISCEAQINYKSKAVVKTNMIEFMLERTLGTSVVEGNTPSKDVASLELHYQNGVVVVGSTVNVTDAQIRRALGDDVITQDNFDTTCATFMEEHPEYKGEKGDPGTNGQDGLDGKSAFETAQDGGYEGTEEDFAAALNIENTNIDFTTGWGD